MFNRYYAIKNSDGYYRGHMIVPPTSIELVASASPMDEIHASIALYNGNNIYGCPIVFDVDFNGDLARSLQTTKHICSLLNRMSISYDTFFSGSKGFHVTVNSIISVSNPIMMLRAIKKTYFDIDGVDDHIYRENSLLRCEGSINHKSNLYKCKVDLNSSLDEILQQAKIKPKLVINNEYKINHNIQSLINGAYPLYKELIKPRHKQVSDGMFEAPICVKKMWEDTDPPRHIWHTIIYTIAKSMAQSGLTSEQAISCFDNHEFWGCVKHDGYSRRSYTKVISSVFRSDRNGIGCRNGLSADAMKHYCSRLCPIINRDNLWSELVETNNNRAVRSV